MNRHQSELLIFVGILTAFLLGLLLAWLGLPVLTREMRLGLVIIVALLLAGAAFWLNRLVQAHRFGLRRLAEELELILRSNPAHRVRPGTLATEKRLATAVNTFADRYQQQLAAEAEKMTQAQAALAAEKQRLAALIADMGEGVLVCNREGQILLFNGRSQHLLDTPDQSGSLVGLGRSILALFDRQVIAHVLEEAATRPETRRVVQFTATASNGRLLRLRLVPVAAESEAETGFIVTLEDLTQQQAQQLDQRLWPLVEGLRAPAANIRAAIETVMDYAAMPADQRQRLQQVVYEEAGRLSETVEELTAVYNSHPPANLQLDPMLGRDLLWALERRLRPLGAVAATLPPDDLWLLADSYLLRHVVLFLAEKLVAQWQPHHLELRLQPLRQRAALDLVWVADESVEPVWAWLDETIPALGQTARQVTAHHDGELWVQREGATAFVRLLLPLTVWESTPLPLLGSRPEYYDFDLLQRPLPAADWAERPLRELTYTVFDTETTGLDPSTDEIVAMGAVRIVNGRLLRQDVFDQLVDPQCFLSPQATVVHGITPAMVQGQPAIDVVLPRFHRFAADTVLLGHNVAFDMRLLQLKEAATGVVFAQPVLDTLLLAALLFPERNDYSLESLARDFGVVVAGRHTALGDALITGDLFLKMVPLLAERGIVTLGESLTAVQQTHLARLRY